MESYSINAVEQLTGVKAHTLRIWEKRYNALIPHRTPTNIRYYDDEQLRKLLNISTLQQHGHRISTLMAMEDSEINDLLVAMANDDETGDQYDVYISSLISYMLIFDEPAFDKVYSNIIIRLGLFDAMTKVVYPFLRKTGILWSISNATPAQEHFASNIIKRKLLSAIDGIPYHDKAEKKFLLFLPPDEWHEIGLLLADYLIRSAGMASIYLGQNVPFSSLQLTVEKWKPDHLVTFFTSGLDMDDHIRKLSAIVPKSHKGRVILCTNAAVKDKGKYPNINFLDSPEGIFKYL